MQNLVGKYLVIVFAMMTTKINGIREVGIGVILDMDSNVGKSCRVSILMALEEFYGAPYNNFTTIIHPHFHDSKSSNFEAASVASDLITNTQVMAILGPQQSSQANFVLDIANRYKVPILSPATSPSLSPKQNPYFIRIAQTSSTQAQPIAALVKSFGWREITLVYEDTDFGRGPISYMFDAMVTIGTQVKYQSILSPSSTDDEILQHLYKLKTMQTRVFVMDFTDPEVLDLLQLPSPIYQVEKIPDKEVDPILYMLNKEPPLDVIRTWSNTHYASPKAGIAELKGDPEKIHSIMNIDWDASDDKEAAHSEAVTEIFKKHKNEK
ncbi:Extracellular ligand-binding receptor [Artemisia annua]|uniref:Extracellular ligand-binding receptor n=1 Tax=Artemisia annua TaxID=35608 RepID=A0A2U1Q7L5_ARTAN|nr:Extracellular ligand-binding receptor [Artemisia annua]